MKKRLELNKKVKKVYFFLRKILSIRERLFKIYCKLINYKFKNQTQILAYVTTKTLDELLIKYSKFKVVPEFEHQVGRFINMSLVSKELKSQKKNFSVVEFGTYKGLGLLLLDRAFSGNQTNNSITYVGIDSFTGLPENSTIWRKGDFSDVTYGYTLKNLLDNKSASAKIKLINSSFADLHHNKEFNQIIDILVFHFDADLGKSTEEALYISESYLQKAKPKSTFYFLFDDWGCHPDEVPDAFNLWFQNFNKHTGARLTKIYTTKLTRYYKVQLLN